MASRVLRQVAPLAAAVALSACAGGVSTADRIGLPGHPFEAVALADGQTLLVSLGGNDGEAGIAVLGRDPAGISVRHVLPLDEPGRGLALSPHGQIVAVAGGGETLLLRLDQVLAGHSGAPVLRIHGQDGAIGVAFSPDGRWFAVSEENAGRVMLVDLRGDRRQKELAVGRSPVGLAFSPDGKWLYVTSEIARRPGGTCPASGRDAAVAPGLVSSIALERATPHVSASAEVGCAPVRIVLSRDGGTAFVSLRAEDKVAAFDTAALRAGSGQRRWQVAVGPSPVGLALSADGHSLVVADSNRFERGEDGAVSCVAISGGTAKEASRVPGGSFPRNVAALPDGRDVVTLFGETGLQIVPGACP